jgi:hypothetical protein
MMRSGVNEFLILTIKKYLFKLRSYSGYLCGLILAQVLALAFSLSGASSFGISVGNTHVTVGSYSALLALVFSVVWVFIISVLLASRACKDASFSFPGNRLTDSLSDLAYILTGCLFGALTTALFGSALRVVTLMVFPGHVLAQGFAPVFSDLCVIAAAAFFYMLLVSAVGFFSGTLFRLSKLFIVVVASIIVFFFFSVAIGGLSIWSEIGGFLFQEESLPFFALIMGGISLLFYAAGTLISNCMEVKK